MLWLVALAALACGDAEPAPAAPSPEPIPSPVPVPAAEVVPSPAPEPVSTPTAIPTSSGIGPAATPLPNAALSLRRVSVPELDGISNWINSEPLTLAELQGRVVLLDFWTYTCINCIRTFPYLREWHEKYADSGLVIIGVHTPEFEFERSTANVEAAAMEHGLTYPIAQDNEYASWQAFRVQAWPTKFILDRDGLLAHFNSGEGGYDQIEQIIRGLLEEAGADLDGILPSIDPGPERDPFASSSDIERTLTRELYGGFMRNIVQGGAYIQNEEYYDKINSPIEYTDPGQRRNNLLFLHGQWHNGPESITHARQTEEYEDYLGIQFFANEVNAVINFETDTPYDVRLTLDGEPMSEAVAGADVRFDEDGNSFVTIDEARMYRLVDSAEVESRELLLSSNSDAFSLNVFTFGAYKNSTD